jgi:capsular exopolysaccharide synthesis family protein
MTRLGIQPVTDGPGAVSDRAPTAIRAVIHSSVPTADAAQPSAIEESFRTLRTNLLLRASSAVRVFVVASATPGEGKSTIAANLACSLADLRKRVLLIDADLRRPAAHRLFDLSNNRGLSDVLRGALRAEDAWQTTPQGVVVMTSGAPPADPQTLFESADLARVIADVRDKFDVVLIDSPPVLAVADTTLLVSHADAAVLVLKYGGVTEAEASLAVKRLQMAHGTVIGCVLSQVTEAQRAFHSYAGNYARTD